jgi:enoyl-CoA hydratase/carnithine racemase
MNDALVLTFDRPRQGNALRREDMGASPVPSMPPLTRRLLHRHISAPVDEALDAEATAVELSRRGEDFKAGLRAFGSGQRAPFTGR